jgi:UDP-4-amino-4,6-dideoxy-N-acetyl-beta-L-altrosamine transaminase
MKDIPYGRHWVDEEDIESVIQVLSSDRLTQGPMVDLFEEKVAGCVGAKYAVAFNSGTSALHGAMFAAGIKPRHEVITSPLTFVATPNSAIYLGGKPVFVDISRDTYCIDCEKIPDAVSANTKVIAPVDYAGYPLDITPLMELASERGIIVIEDAAHALGARRNGKMVGSEADMTMFSFHPVKAITTGEGGVIVTNNEGFSERMRIFRSHGITKDPKKMTRNDGPWYYEMQELGHNYRITDIQCALGISQLKKLDGFIKRRNEIALKYSSILGNNPNIRIPPMPDIPAIHAYHLYPILVNSGHRSIIFQKLREKRIFSQVHYIPVHLQPYYRKRFGYREGEYPVAEEFYSRELSIPIFPKMKDDEIEYVSDTVNGITRG